LPAGYTTGYVGQSKELGKSLFYFALAIALSFIFMYIVLAAQFESFIHPPLRNVVKQRIENGNCQ
jgi:HAE1 family hydrophobic/amphiphilic exporter-1